MTPEEVVAEIASKVPCGATFVEVGVLRATTLIYVAEQCDNIEVAIGIDNYKPYVDHLASPYSVGKELAALNKSIAEESIIKSKSAAKISLLVEDAVVAAGSFKNGSIDCVYLDAYMCKAQVVDHILAWEPKVKSGGVLCGHDVHSKAVLEALEDMGMEHSIVHQSVWEHWKP